MGETEAIAKMAEFMSNETFSVFKWTRTGPVNSNWECVHQERHNRKTHPSDVVFYYDSPYASRRVYINVDLKSYAKNSISKGAISSALDNLVLSVECANSSPEWQDRYIHTSRNFDIHGLLYVYNHDGEYDADFMNIAARLHPNTTNLQCSSRIYLLSPQKICYIATIANDLEKTIGRLNNPKYEFFYPDLSRKANVLAEWAGACTIEMLTSPMIIVKYHQPNDPNNDHGIFLYYSRKGETREEFSYLLEWLFHYQVFQNAGRIDIRIIEPAKNAIAQFEKAKEHLIESSGDDAKDLAGKLQKVTCSSVTTIMKKYSEIEIGMGDRDG